MLKTILGGIALAASALCQQALDFSAIDRTLEGSLSSLNPGLSVRIELEGRVLHERAYGNYEVNRRVPIASATKWYSAAVILALVDEARLSLNDTTARYLPEFTGDKGAITLRQLFSHTSGIVADAPCIFNSTVTLRECVTQIAGRPLLFAPGTRFHYGNAGMHVGAAMAEAATGKPWAQLFEEKLVEPLGMICTRPDGLGSADHPVPAGGAASCEEDYAKFLQMLAAGGVHEGRRILSSAVVSEMERDQTGGVAIDHSLYESYGDLDPQLPLLRYGLGVWRERGDARTGDALELSSQGAFGFSPWVDLERGLVGVLSANSSQDLIMPAYLELKDLLRQMAPRWTERTTSVTSGASFRLGPVSPGELVSLFGVAIGPAEARTLSLAEPGVVASILGGYRVLFDGRPAPLIYVGWDQINTVVPFGVEGKDRVTVEVERNGVAGPRTTVAVAPASPGIFTIESSGNGGGAIVNEDGTVNSPANPAPRGSVIAIYATGGGQTDPPAEDGMVQLGAPRLRLPAQVRIGGVDAGVEYAGAAPGLVAGVLQINASITENHPIGDAVPVEIAIGGVVSQPGVTVSVR
jgi:serine-type D-Ala-D-Ala carboxypeptidase/endopeptidase